MPHKKPTKPVKSKLKAKPKAKPKRKPGKDYGFLSTADAPRGPAWTREPSRYNKGIKRGIKKK